MTWLRERALTIAGGLCLIGQGVLLLTAGAGSRVVRPSLGPLFLILTLLLAGVLAFALMRRGRPLRWPHDARWLPLLLAVGVQLAAGVGWMRAGDVAGRTPRAAAPLAAARTALSELPAALDELAVRLATDPRLGAAAAAADGDLTRLISRWAGHWPELHEQARRLPLALVLWKGEHRLAWSTEAEPLELTAAAATAAADGRDFTLEAGRRGWVLRRVLSLPEGLTLEQQIPLTGAGAGSPWPHVRWRVVDPQQVPVVVDATGNAVADVVLSDPRHGLALRLEAADIATTDAPVVRRTRFFLLAMAAWGVLAAVLGGLGGGLAGLLAGLWLARGVLAAVGWFTRFGPALGGLQTPARPAAAGSLIDPAYFATPFAGGWLASTADALLSALLLAGTAWIGQRLIEGRGPARFLPGEPGSRRHLLAATVLFGLPAAAAWMGLRGLVALVAANANARLVGDGVSLSSLSFWGLHAVLGLAGFSVAALGTGLLVWLTDGVTTARRRFRQRLVWSALVMAVLGWHYLSLREVYDAAERNWLSGKGEVITESSAGWMRFLIEEALTGMQAADADTLDGSGDAADLWRDQAAYRLWRRSALRDLGTPCLVELIAPDGGEESLFATAGMRDFGYEVAGRSEWTDRDGNPAAGEGLIFQTEGRRYHDGEELVLSGEGRRDGDRGWIRVEVPVRSWRLSSLVDELTGRGNGAEGAYRPRSEVDRPLLVVRGNDGGWLDAGEDGFPGPDAAAAVAALKAGQRPFAEITVGRDRWLCRWVRLPEAEAATPGEGFLLGLARSGFSDDLLDYSRFVLLNLVLLAGWFLLMHGVRRLAGGGPRPGDWNLGFQERFLAGYLVLGLVLLLVVGASVDRVGHDRIRDQARGQTLAGLELAVQQLRSLLVEQASSLAASEYIADLLVGQLAEQRPIGPLELRQGMVFTADGTLLLDETLSDLDPAEARALLDAARSAPLVVVRQQEGIFLGTAIPIDLEDVLAAAAAADSSDGQAGHGAPGTGGFFFYRQRLDAGLLEGLADLVRGQATLSVDGQPVLTSHPAGVFAGRVPLLADPRWMASLLDHPAGPGVFAAPDRPFAFTGAQPVPAFGLRRDGSLERRPLPAVLGLEFPDREREFGLQRRGTVLFLAGLANVILLTALLLALLLSWNIFRPLRVLLAATRSLARGDFRAPLPEPGGDEVGRLSAAFGLMRDELGSARDRLAAREQFLTTVLDRVTVGVAVLDAGDEVVALNPAGRQILSAFLPQTVGDASVTGLLALVRGSAAGAERWTGELRSADGRRTLRAAMAPLELPVGRTDTMLVFEDITEFLRTRLMAVNAELARQVAHEIKNPLTPIQLSVQLLDQAWRDGHPELDRIVRETVGRVLDQVSLLRSIASEFSLLGKPGELAGVPLDLAALVRRVAGAYGAGEPEGGGPRVVGVGEPPRLVLGDEDALLKILGNLMQNSLDAADPERPLEISVRWSEDERSVTLHWLDNGSGLAPEVADRLFDPYFSTKSKGTGLGLAICRNLADRMGGAIELADRPDGPGTVAGLTLPRA